MFLILCLPRSRSAWMAHYLNYPLARPIQPVGHDILLGCERVEDFLNSYRNGMWGTVETSAAPLWKIVRKELPECKIVVVKRPLIEVWKSLNRIGWLGDLTELAELSETLNVAAAAPGVECVYVQGLDSPEVGKWLFEYCLEIDFDFEWWMDLHRVNIQVDVAAQAERVQRAKDLKPEILERSREIECLN